MPATLEPIKIEELTGKRRVLILNGTTLPREGRETNFGMKQRNKINRYTGNAAARGQVLGPEWKPIRFGGVLEDRRMGEVGAAQGLANYMQELAKAGRECLLQYGDFQRRVLWADLEFKTVELETIEYRIEFDVLDDGQGERRQVKQGTREIPDATDTVDKMDEAEEQLEAIPDEVGGDEVETAKEQVREARDQTVAAKEQIDIAAVPGQILDSAPAKFALTLLQNARSALFIARDVTEAIDWYKEAGKNDVESIAGAGLNVLTARSGLAAAARSLIGLRDSVSQLAGAVSQGQVYIAKHGDTLQRISDRFYGTPERWQDIYTDNGLDSPNLEGGEQLILKDVPAPDFESTR